MNIKSLVPKINTSLGNFKESFLMSIYEFRKTTKYEHSQKCDVLMVHPNSIGEMYEGLTDEANSFLFVPLLLRIFSPSNLNDNDNGLTPILYNGKKMFIVSSEYHGTLNLILLGKIFSKLTHNVHLKLKYDDQLKQMFSYYWKFHDNLIEFECKNIPSVIDVHFLDNKYSLDFTAASHRVISTKSLAFLEEVPRRVYILTMVIVGGIASVITALFISVLWVIFFIVMALLFNL